MHFIYPFTFIYPFIHIPIIQLFTYINLFTYHPYIHIHPHTHCLFKLTRLVFFLLCLPNSKESYQAINLYIYFCPQPSIIPSPTNPSLSTSYPLFIDVCLSIHPFFWLFIHLSIHYYPSFHPFIQPPINLCTNLSIFLLLIQLFIN